jgi:hypothetical protein
MTEKCSMLLRRTVGILVAISIIVAGVCLAFGCCYIYFSDGITYSRIAVADVFAVICIPVYICLFLVVFGFLAELFLPDAVSKKSNVSVSSVNKVNNILKKRGSSSLSDEALAVHYREKGKRTFNSVIMLALTVIASVVFFVYALDQSNFDNTDINGSVISALYVLAPCVLVPFSFFLYLLIDRERGYKKELAVLKAVSKVGNSGSEYKPRFENFDVFVCKTGIFFEKAVSGRPLVITRSVIAAIALLCLVFGLVFGGTADVFTKASNICTECIGLG